MLRDISAALTTGTRTVPLSEKFDLYDIGVKRIGKVLCSAGRQIRFQYMCESLLWLDPATPGAETAV